MGCWNFGNMLPSANISGFNYFLSQECPNDKQAALQDFAAKYFPGCDAQLTITAWGIFDKAMDYYPFTIAFLYHGPQNYTLAYKGGYHAEPHGYMFNPAMIREKISVLEKRRKK